MPAVVDREQCRGCGTCAETCEQGAIQVLEHAVVDADRCTECGACAASCPHGAIVVVLEPGTAGQADRPRETPLKPMPSRDAPSPTSPLPPEPLQSPQPVPRGEPAASTPSLLSTVLRIAEQVAGAIANVQEAGQRGSGSGRSPHLSDGGRGRTGRPIGGGRRTRYRGGR
jgi:NAD-dependent dihydropyrimidine dehydrogenase PreA subunit